MTKPIKVISRWERLKRLTVWHPMNTDPKDDDRWTVRVWLPLYDVLAITAGVIAFWVGSPLLNRLFPEPVVDSASLVFLVAGFITLIGVCMSFMLTSYALLVLTFPSVEALNNSFITIILVMATWGVYPRLTRLFIRGYQDSLARKAARSWGH